MKDIQIGYGHLGNGLTVWNNSDETCPTIAHIAPDRVITYTTTLSEATKSRIQYIALHSDANISTTQPYPVFSTPPLDNEMPNFVAFFHSRYYRLEWGKEEKLAFDVLAMLHELLAYHDLRLTDNAKQEGAYLAGSSYKTLFNGITKDAGIYAKPDAPLSHPDRTPLENLTIAVVDTIEDELSSHNIYIPDEFREGEESEACIYGSTFDEMCSAIEDYAKEQYPEVFGTPKGE